jgi:hypothetical protein
VGTLLKKTHFSYKISHLRADILEAADRGTVAECTGRDALMRLLTMSCTRESWGGGGVGGRGV